MGVGVREGIGEGVFELVILVVGLVLIWCDGFAGILIVFCIFSWVGNTGFVCHVTS